MGRLNSFELEYPEHGEPASRINCLLINPGDSRKKGELPNEEA